MVQQMKADQKKWFEKGTKMINRNANNLLHLVNQMLDLSKLEAGMLTVNLEQADIVKYLRYIVESFHSLAQQKKITIHLLNDIDQLVMDYDPEKIRNIISNLLSNAIKFTPENGNIYLFTELTELEHQPALMLRMKDTGIGIGPEQLPHIFDRFYQADNSTTRKGEGTGIGLALTLELVKLMSGTINVKSVPKKGTEFTIILPITKEAPVKQEENIHEPEEDIPLDIDPQPRKR